MNSVHRRDGFTPMFLAASGNHAHAIECLAARGGDVNKSSKKGSPVHEAADRGHVAALEALADAGAALNEASPEGCATRTLPPLHYY